MADLVGTKGGSGVWQRIISEMPEHDVFIEAFWGRGTISKKKRPANLTVGVDLDPDAISDGMRSQAMMFQCDSLDWLTGYFGLAACPASSDPMSHDLAASAGAATFGGFNSRNHLVYLDPPYMGFEDYYKFRADHSQVIDVFLALPCPAMLSGYESEYYADRLSDCRSIQIETVNRAGKRCTEWLWMNFPKPRRYHDTRFAGRGRRERERIRRRVKKWREGLERMPLLERQAVLEACAATMSGEDL